MDFRFKVHSASQGPMTTQATLPGGQVVEATVQGMVAELVSDDGTMSQTYRFIPEDFAAATELFAVDAEVVVSVAAAPSE